MAVQSFPIPPSTSGKAPRWTQPVSFYGQSVFSKYYAQSICVFLLLIPFLISPVAAQGQGAIGGQDCVTNYNPADNVDYFPSKITVDNAALFKVRYANNYKVVTNTAGKKDFVLYQCGTTAPPASEFANGTIFVPVPVKMAASLTTTSVAFIEMLGRRSALKVVDTEGLVSSPCVQLGLEKGEIVGLEDNNKTLRAEQFKAVEIVFGSGFSVENGTESKTVGTSEVSDPGPLNRAEWLEFYSTFFNLEESAQKLTASINNNYNCFKSAANAKATKPLVAWSSYVAPSSYNNNTATWTLSPAEYKKILTVDAGATFYNGTTKGTFTNSAEFLAAIKDVDIIIDETFSGSDMTAFYASYGLTNADTANYKFLANKAVFRQDGLVNPNDGRDWFGGAVAMADAALQDIVRATHPEALPKDIKYNWLRNIAMDEPKQLLNSANCPATDSSTPVPDRAITCSTMKVDEGKGNAANKAIAGSALTAFVGLLASALVF
ncbi:hypothetical protein BG015_003080 [Linnemannia schmuckeri]|uniref:Periplasmic binding protein n=1 Tax=Linnemannia schmuckeri TaxID=64567 RepID=A0A9P5S5C2_9FUNG|nr:hypothetical protein BG015_003080 [Linnemannia schmuckeri]